MTFALSPLSIVGLAAGALIILIGAFVLAARPNSWLHRLFFLLALADGASTILFEVGYMATVQLEALYYHGLYWYYYLAFIALLALFGALFPARFPRPRVAILLAGAAIVGFLGALFLYMGEHALFWSGASRQAGGFFQQEPLGNYANTAFVLVMALILVRLTRVFLHESSRSHRDQAAYVLGGMALAYAPGPATFVALALLNDPSTAFLAARPDRLVAYWSYALALVALVASLVLLVKDRRGEVATTRRFVLACYAGVGLMAVLTLAFPSVVWARALRSIALLAYPVLLGFAIARYEVFDIDAKLRRAATVSLMAVGLTMAFILAESSLENAVAQTVLGGLPSAAFSGAIAAVVTAIAFVPIARASRKAASKLVPELSHDELHQRKREIYLHSLAGAMADGILKEGESRTLAVLRESLGISDAEHKALLAQVKPA